MDAITAYALKVLRKHLRDARDTIIQAGLEDYCGLDKDFYTINRIVCNINDALQEVESYD